MNKKNIGLLSLLKDIDYDLFETDDEEDDD